MKPPLVPPNPDCLAPFHPPGHWLPESPRPDVPAPEFEPAEPYPRPESGPYPWPESESYPWPESESYPWPESESSADWLACAPGRVLAAVADGVERTFGRRPDEDGDGTAVGTTAATGELTGLGISAAPITGLPWLGIAVTTTAAVAAARTASVIVPVITPVRKLISSSRALMAARMPDPEPTIR